MAEVQGSTHGSAARTFVSLAARCVWPAGVLSKLGVVWSSWSFLNLLFHAFNVGFGPAFQVAASYYDRALGQLLRPFEEWLSPLLLWASGLLRLSPELLPHWKHLFVLIGLYVFRSAAVVWGRGERITGVFRFVVGALAALLASIIAGLIPGNSGDRFEAFLVVAIPLAGVFIYNVASAIWDALLLRPVPHRLRRVSLMSYPASMARDPGAGYAIRATYNLLDHLITVGKRYALALLFVAGSLFIPGVMVLPGPGVVILAVLVCFVAISNIAYGAMVASALRYSPGGRNQETPWAQLFLKTGSGLLGMSMLAVLFWTTVFVLGNAGFGLVGL